LLIPERNETPMLLRGFSYAMSAVFAGGLAFTIIGASQAMMGF